MSLDNQQNHTLTSRTPDSRQVLALIPLYAKIAPSQPENEFSLPSVVDATSESAEFDFPASLVILTESKSNQLSARFRREADAYYIEAKRSMVSSISQVPVWIYGVMLVLGWNEIVAVIRSPIYFTFLLLVSAAAYITWHLNMVSGIKLRSMSQQIADNQCADWPGARGYSWRHE